MKRVSLVALLSMSPLLCSQVRAADPPGDRQAEANAAPEELARKQAAAKAQRELGQQFAAHGRLDDALAAYAKALDIWPAYPLALNEVGAVLANQGKLVRAVASLEKALALAPDFLAARANLAEVQRRLSRFDEAEGNYRAVLESDRDDVDSLYGIAFCWQQRGAHPAALWALKRHLERAVEPSAGLLADVQSRIRELEAAGVTPVAPQWLSSPPETAEAAAPLQERKRGEPGPLPGHTGDALFYQQHYSAALEAYLAEFATTPNDVVLIYKIGATHAVMRNYRDARRWWRRALKLEPERELVVRHMGLAAMRLAERQQLDVTPRSSGDPMTEAGDALIADEPARALALLYDQPGLDAERLRGEARLSLGQLSEARAAFERVLTARPEDRAALGGLAETLVRLGATTPARQAMAKWLGDRTITTEEFLVLRANDPTRLELTAPTDAPADATLPE